MRRSALGFAFAFCPCSKKAKKQRQNLGPNAARIRHTSCEPTPHARLREKPQGFDTALGYKGWLQGGL
jgi:hypothetical protein